MNALCDISVIIPTWNSAATIGAALDSMLRQTPTPLEIIVVDDGSTDDTARVLAPYRDQIKYLYQENAGPSAARNRGLAIAQGALISFIDADDLLPPDALATLRAALDADAQLDVAHGQLCEMREHEGTFVLDEPRYGAQPGSFLFRRTVFDRVGHFEESLRNGEDIDLLMRLKEQGINTLRLPHVTYWYRRYPAQTTGRARHVETLAHLLKRSLDRTRPHST